MVGNKQLFLTRGINTKQSWLNQHPRSALQSLALPLASWYIARLKVWMDGEISSVFPYFSPTPDISIFTSTARRRVQHFFVQMVNKYINIHVYAERRISTLDFV